MAGHAGAHSFDGSAVDGCFRASGLAGLAGRVDEATEREPVDYHSPGGDYASAVVVGSGAGPSIGDDCAHGARRAVVCGNPHEGPLRRAG